MIVVVAVAVVLVVVVFLVVVEDFLVVVDDFLVVVEDFLVEDEVLVAVALVEPLVGARVEDVVGALKQRVSPM
jgi:hypothetical protein